MGGRRARRRRGLARARRAGVGICTTDAGRAAVVAPRPHSARSPLRRLLHDAWCCSPLLPPRQPQPQPTASALMGQSHPSRRRRLAVDCRGAHLRGRASLRLQRWASGRGVGFERRRFAGGRARLGRGSRPGAPFKGFFCLFVRSALLGSMSRLRGDAVGARSRPWSVCQAAARRRNEVWRLAAVQRGVQQGRALAPQRASRPAMLALVPLAAGGVMYSGSVIGVG